ncbi:MAG: lipopolysaccharide biosynthesis protein [Acidobacteria bacterium]|nr:lipopolysaccharide biosynthesis protein [Acidobacteriota bacterium]
MTEETNTSKAAEHLRTDDVRAELGARTARGGAVTMVSQGLRFGVMIVMTAILGRLLTPHDYGLVGMVGIVMGFVALFKDLGLASATIQREELSQREVSTLFWLNLGFSVCVALLTTAVAPLVARFFGEPRLTAITAAYSIGFLFGGLAVQHEALLRRRMRFAALAGANLVALFVNAAVTIGLAWLGFGYWALVCGQLALGAAYAVCLWGVCGWRPGRPGRLSEVRALLAFGRDLTGFTIVNYFARNLDNLLIGRVWGAVQLGFYAKAYQLLLLPLDQVNEPVTAVAVPALSRLGDDPERYRRAYLRLLEKVAMATMPLMAFMIAASDWIVRVVLGPQWGETARIFMLLGISGLFQPIANTTGWLLISQGRARHLAQWGLIGGSISVAAIVAGLPWGPEGVALSYSLARVLLFEPLLYWWVGREGPVHMLDFYRTVAPAAAASAGVLAAVYGLRQWAPFESALPQLVAAAAVAGLVALPVLFAIPAGRRALRDAGQVLLILKPGRSEPARG